MKSESKFCAPLCSEATVSAEVMAMAASLAREIAEKWPFMAAHLRLEVFGAVGHSHLNAAIGQAVTLGLSGIVDGAAAPRKVAGALALQQRMMAVRLAGRKLIAFHPDRDLTFVLTQHGGVADRVRVSVWSTEGALVGKAERTARFADQPEKILRTACA